MKTFTITGVIEYFGETPGTLLCSVWVDRPYYHKIDLTVTAATGQTAAAFIEAHKKFIAVESVRISVTELQKGRYFASINDLTIVEPAGQADEPATITALSITYDNDRSEIVGLFSAEAQAIDHVANRLAGMGFSDNETAEALAILRDKKEFGGPGEWKIECEGEERLASPLERIRQRLGWQVYSLEDFVVDAEVPIPAETTA